MNLWVRWVWLWLKGRTRAPVHPLGPCRTPFRVSLFDLDVFRHMNNGRYFTIMDIARVDMMRRSGMLAKLDRAGFFPVVIAELMLFRKALSWGQAFEIETELVAWDEKSLLVSQRFLIGDDEVAGGLVRARFLRRSGGSVPTAEIVALAGGDIEHPEKPEGLDDWIALFNAGVPRVVRVTTIVSTCLLLLAACSRQSSAPHPLPMSPSATAASAAITAARARSNAAIAAHDTAAISQEWMPDIHVVSSTGAQNAGADANARSMAAAFARRPDTKWVRIPTRINAFEAWAVASEEGEWVGTWTDPDGPVRISGTYLAQWRETNGRWRIQAEVFVPTRCEGRAYCARHP